MQVYLSGAVEGPLDQAVFERLAKVSKAEVRSLYVTGGKPGLLRRLRGFNAAARHAPWLVLVDLDHDTDCAPPFLQHHIQQPAPWMACRVAVRGVEAWLLADRQRLADWIRVPVDKVPTEPELEDDPKQTLVNLARRSRSSSIRQDMVPRAGSRRQVGSLYTSQLINFVQDERRGWRPTVAARSSDSLERCLRRLTELVAQARAKYP